MTNIHVLEKGKKFAHLEKLKYVFRVKKSCSRIFVISSPDQISRYKNSLSFIVKFHLPYRAGWPFISDREYS